MFYGLDNQLGVPLGMRVHHIAPLIGAGLIAGAGSLIGGLFGSKSTSSANSTNMKIAQMNNEFNESMMNKQIQYNWDMWNAQNKYNDPSAQMQRLTAAGISPYQMLNGSNAGVAGTGGSVSAPTAQPVQVQPYDWSQSFSQAGNQIAQSFINQAQVKQMEANANLMNANAQNVNIESQYKAQSLQAEIQNKLAAAGVSNSMIRKITQDVRFANQMQPLSLQGASLQNEFQKSQNALISVQLALSQKELKYFDANAQSQLALTFARIKSELAAGSLSRAQAKTEFKKQLLIGAQTSGQKIQNSIAERSADSLVDTARYQAEKERGASYDANTNYRYDNYNSNGVVDFINGAARVFHWFK